MEIHREENSFFLAYDSKRSFVHWEGERIIVCASPFIRKSPQ